MSTTGKLVEFVPRAKSVIQPNDSAYLQEQLQAISRSIHALVEMTPQSATRAPRVPMESMIRYAMYPWWPVSGQTANAWVTFVNGAWGYLKDN